MQEQTTTKVNPGDLAVAGDVWECTPPIELVIEDRLIAAVREDVDHPG